MNIITVIIIVITIYYLHPGTHGSGVGVGNLATLVTRIQLVTGEGKVRKNVMSMNLILFQRQG